MKNIVHKKWLIPKGAFTHEQIFGCIGFITCVKTNAPKNLLKYGRTLICKKNLVSNFLIIYIICMKNNIYTKYVIDYNLILLCAIPITLKKR